MGRLAYTDSAMKNIVGVIIFATLFGTVLGIALASWEVGQVDHSLAPQGSFERTAASEDSEVTVGPAMPKLEIAETSFDFGTMQRGTSMSHEFVFRNVGEADLWLEVGSTTCKCTGAVTEEKAIKPGETGSVSLQWVAKVGAGPFEQRAEVFTNDSLNSPVELTVKGIVTDISGLSPSEFLLGKMSADQQQKASVYLASYIDEGLTVEAEMAPGTLKPELYELSVENVAVEELPMQGAKSGVRIDITAGPKLPLGNHTAWIQAKTNQPDIGEILIPAIGVVEGDITFHGRHWSAGKGLVNLGKINSKEGLESRLTISVRGENASGAEIRVGECSPEWLNVELGDPKQITDNKTHIPMILRVPPGMPSMIRTESGQGEGDAHVQLLTNHPSTPEIDMRVRFIIAN